MEEIGKRLRGYCGIGIYNVKNEINYGTLFRSANCFGASFLFLIGKRFKKQCSDTMRSERHIPVFEYDSFENFYENIPYGCQLVGIEICERAKDLGTFAHPLKAAYILGQEDGSLPPEILNRCVQVVKIQTSACLNVAVAGSIVLYDRQRKIYRGGKPNE